MFYHGNKSSYLKNSFTCTADILVLRMHAGCLMCVDLPIKDGLILDRMKTRHNTTACCRPLLLSPNSIACCLFLIIFVNVTPSMRIFPYSRVLNPISFKVASNMKRQYIHVQLGHLEDFTKYILFRKICRGVTADDSRRRFYFSLSVQLPND